MPRGRQTVPSGLARAAWDVITLTGLVVSPAAWAAWSVARHERPERLLEWWGLSPRVAGRPAWIHAASVGEVRAAEPLVRLAHAEHPEAPLALSVVTATGRRTAAPLAPLLAAPPFAPPLDAAPSVASALDRLRPRALFSVETEIWPNLWAACARRGVGVALVNGRISPRSFPRYLRARPLLEPTLDHASVLAMRSVEDAERILALGAPADRVKVTGDVKFDAAASQADAPDLEWASAAGLADGRWIAFASTAEGEESLVLDAFETLLRSHPGLRAILAPRHAERWEEAAARVARRGIPLARRSALASTPVAEGGILLLDSVGELARLYRHAEVVFVGGSLVPRGGQNLMEPAAAGRPVLFGPHAGNFRDAERVLLACGAGERVDPPGLAPAIDRLLRDDAERLRRGAAGADAVRRNAGATRRTLEAIEPLLRPSERSAP